MKIYLVNFIRGYHIGGFRSLNWSNKAPTISAVEPMDVRGIDEETLHGYWDYLWRLGEYTFGARYAPRPPVPIERLELERFVQFSFLRLWPTFGRLWSAVGATKGWFDQADVLISEKIVGPGLTSRLLIPYNIILRYREFLWWARLVFSPILNEWFYEMGPPIGSYLMFERRSRRKTPPFTDEWDFGMCWWEIVRVRRHLEVYLWAYGEAEYLGFGIRRSTTLFSLQHK